MLNAFTPEDPYDFARMRKYSMQIRNFSILFTDVLGFPTKEMSGGNSVSSSAIAGLVVGIIFIAIVLVVVLMTIKIVKRRRRKPQFQMMNTNNPFHVNLRILYPERYDSNSEDLPRFEIPRFRLIVHENILGGGYFGTVKKGTYISPLQENNDEDGTVQVAVKTLKSINGATDWTELLRELEILKHINETCHPNVIGLIGACTLEVPILIALEYCAGGNLQRLLIGSRVYGNTYENIFSKLTQRQLIKFAEEIACGMNFLCKMQVVHRDIASRNILIDEKLNAKIGDFGLARKVDACEYYVVQKNKMLPVKWMAMESIEKGKFSFASDRWSYGVLLWEICTLGDEPYPEISHDNLLAYLKEGNRMQRPIHCSEEIFSLMERCWETDPEKRPDFGQILNSLQRMLTNNERVYVNVKTVEGNIEHTNSSFTDQKAKELIENKQWAFVQVQESNSAGGDSGVFDTS